MKRFDRFVLSGAILLAAAFALVSCAKKEPAPPAAPVYYDDETLARAGELNAEGYELLAAGKADSAAAKFAEVGGLLPGSVSPLYNAACAYARGGNAEEAFRALERMVRGGMDYVEALEGDPDFESLRDDARFVKLIESARNNYARGTAFLAGGLPGYDASADTFTTEESLKLWKNERDAVRYANREYWTLAQLLADQSRFAARYLANMKRIKAGDPSFDYGLERVRAASRLASVYSPGWASVSDCVRREADSYLQAAPSGEGSAEANYLAAIALSLKYPSDDPRRLDEYGKANAYLDKIGPGTKYTGAAYALRLVNKAKSPGAEDAVLATELSDLIEEFAGDQQFFRVVAAQLGPEAVRLLWPLRLDVPDIDGTTVSLDEYKGRVLMIDFWATWCGPCRRELPGIAAAYEKYHSKGFEIVSISLDYAERVPAPALRDSVAAHGMKWRHIYDGTGWDTEPVKRWFVGSIPAPFLVGRDGSLAAWGDDLRGEKLAESIEKAL